MDDAIKAALLDAAVMLENVSRNFMTPGPQVQAQYKALASHIRKLLMDDAYDQA
jgi:hypothetical protein